MHRDFFFHAYYDVFTSSGYIKNCSAKNYFTLMRACIGQAHSIGILEPESFGDFDEVTLNVENVKALTKKVYPEISFREAYLRLFDENGNKISDNAEAMDKLRISATETAHFYKMLIIDYDPATLHEFYTYFFPTN